MQSFLAFFYIERMQGILLPKTLKIVFDDVKAYYELENLPWALLCHTIVLKSYPLVRKW